MSGRAQFSWTMHLTSPLKRLSIDRFPDDSRRGLAEILVPTLVRVELPLDSGLCFCLLAQRMPCRELHIAKFTDSEHWSVLDAPDDPKFSLWHGGYFTPFVPAIKGQEIQTAPLPGARRSSPWNPPTGFA
jgi:hypothetical protein